MLWRAGWQCPPRCPRRCPALLPAALLYPPTLHGRGLPPPPAKPGVQGYQRPGATMSQVAGVVPPEKPLPAYPCLSCGPLSRATLPGDGVTSGGGLGGLSGWGHRAKHTTEHQPGLLSGPGAATGPLCKERSPSARRGALDISPAASDRQCRAGLGWTAAPTPRSSRCFWPHRGRSGGTVWLLGCGEQREPHPQEPVAMPGAARSGTAPWAGIGVSLLYVFN